MVKKIFVLMLALAVVAPSVQANVAQQVQAQAEARLVEVTGQALTAQDKEVLKVAVETALEDLPVISESNFSKKQVALISLAVVGVVVTGAYLANGFFRGEWNPINGSFWTTKTYTFKRLTEKAGALRDAAGKETDEVKKKILEERAAELEELAKKYKEVSKVEGKVAEQGKVAKQGETDEQFAQRIEKEIKGFPAFMAEKAQSKQEEEKRFRAIFDEEEEDDQLEVADKAQDETEAARLKNGLNVAPLKKSVSKAFKAYKAKQKAGNVAPSN